MIASHLISTRSLAVALVAAAAALVAGTASAGGPALATGAPPPPPGPRIAGSPPPPPTTPVAPVGRTSGGPPPEPGITTGGTGCAVECISEARVTSTATTARVDLATTVSAHLTVTVRPAGAGGGAAASAAPPAVVAISAFSGGRTAWFPDLRPSTTYEIEVRALDLEGRSHVRSGTFRTLTVEATGLARGDTYGSGVGCSAQCIDKALFTQTKPRWWDAQFEIRSGVPARFWVVVSRDKPVKTETGYAQHDLVTNVSSRGLARGFAGRTGRLLPATRYYAVVRATDAQGRTAVRTGSFRTVDMTTTVTFHKIVVVGDGDSGRNRGELWFDYAVDGDVFGSWGFLRARSGDVLGARVNGAGRPGVVKVLTGAASGPFELGVQAVECDTRYANCVTEAGFPSTVANAVVVARIDTREIVASQSLPPWIGTGVVPPSGHDGYIVLDSGPGHTQIQALATLDIEVAWP